MANIMADELSHAASHPEQIGKSGNLEKGHEALMQLNNAFKRLAVYTDKIIG